MNKIRQSFDSIFQLLIIVLFHSPVDRYQKCLSFLYSFVLYGCGAQLWRGYFNFGYLNFSILDWPKEFAYYSIIKQALLNGEMPYYTTAVFHGTNRFLTLPELIISPQIFLLYFLDVGHFILLHVEILYTIGFLGCIAIQRRYKLAIVPFSILFFLFNFNGYITAHLAVGHTMWAGYFLLSWFVYIILKFFEGDMPASSMTLKIALFLFFVMLQGGLHLYVWCLIFLILLSIFNRGYWKNIFWSIVWSGFLSAIRFLPAMISMRHRKLTFISGYPTIRDFFDALTVIKYPSMDMLGGLYGALYWWESDMFVSFIGVIFITYFGLYIGLKIRKYPHTKNYRQLILPLFIMTIFAFNSFYKFIAELPIPFITVERLPIRFIIIPVVFLLVISVTSAQEFFNSKKFKKTAYFLFLVIFWQLINELLTHMIFWNPKVVGKIFAQKKAFPVVFQNIGNSPLYEQSITIATIITCGTLVVWCMCYIHNIWLKRN